MSYNNQMWLKSILVLIFIIITLQTGLAQPLKIYPCVTEKVIDGDTFYCFYGDEKWKVRLRSVEAFEIKYGKRLTAQAEAKNLKPEEALKKGKEAKKYLEDLLKNPTLINLEVDNQKDPWGRKLAYVWMPSGEMLIDAGHAFLLT